MGDDLALSYKLSVNGFSLLLHYTSGIIHQDGKTGHLDANFTMKLMQSTSVLYVLWHRIRIFHAACIPMIFSISRYILSIICKTLYTCKCVKM